MFNRAMKVEGRLIAAALEGAWRREPPEATLSERELARVSNALIASGAGALAWAKVRRSDLIETGAARDLRQAYRLQTLKAAVREREIEGLFALFNSAGVDALVVKGWAAERAYAEQGLRPAGDIDLCVRPGQYEPAKDVLASTEGRRFWVDLHEGFVRLIDLSADELFERSRVFEVGNACVRVLCEEDHLRLLCGHLLRHGAWRPLWLCDVAAAFESRGEGFDWERLLGRDKRLGRRVVCAVGLAQRLLGARVEETPLEWASKSVPRWLTRAVLKHWERPYASAHESPPPLRVYLRKPSGVFRALRRRWPDPVRATVYCGMPFNGFPRLPLQLGKLTVQSARYLLRLPDELRRGGAARKTSERRDNLTSHHRLERRAEGL